MEMATITAPSRGCACIISPTSADGLIALAGLDLEPPDFLLGALLSVAREAGDLTPEQRAHVATIGRKKLDNGRAASARGNHGGARRICTRSRSAPGSCARSSKRRRQGAGESDQTGTRPQRGVDRG